ncbi:MAG: cytochrome P450 [Paraburkholderia sp.]
MNSSDWRPRFTNEAFFADPYAIYDALREATPIFWSGEFYGGGWILTRYEDVEAMLRDPRFSARRTGRWITGLGSDAKNELQDFQRLFSRAMLFLDAPDHQRMREVLNAGFRGEVMGHARSLIASQVEELIDGIDSRIAFYFVERVARPLPALVIAGMMGVDARDMNDFIAWSNDLAEFIGAPKPTMAQARRARASLLAMSRYFEGRIAQWDSPANNLVDHLVVASRDGRIAGGTEVLAQCAMLLFAGHETSRHFLANSLYHLLAYSEIWELLREEPRRVSAAVRELLRFDSPVQYTARRLAVDMSLHGQDCRRGDLVIGLIGSANRDPRRYQNPQRLDISRKPGQLLAFGSGPHVCIGAGLALAEGEIVINSVLRQWPGLRLAQTGTVWNRNPVYRGLSQLMVIQSPTDHAHSNVQAR